MANSDALALATHLATRLSTAPTSEQVSSPVDLVLGQNLRVSKVQAPSTSTGILAHVPIECVFITPVGSLPEIVELGTTVGTDPGDDIPNPADWPRIRAPQFIITVRGNVNDYDRTAALADAVYFGLHFSPPSGYVDCVLGEPDFVAENPRDSDVFTLTATAYSCP